MLHCKFRKLSKMENLSNIGLFVLFISARCTADNYVPTDTYIVENELHETLMAKYDKRVRPVKNNTTTINLTYGAALYQLVGFDSKKETVTLLMWQRLYWTDEILCWNPVDQHGVNTLRYMQGDKYPKNSQIRVLLAKLAT